MLQEHLPHQPRQEIVQLDEGLQEVAAAGIEAFTAGPAAALVGPGDLARHRRLLDVGGGTGWRLDSHTPLVGPISLISASVVEPAV